MHGIKIEIAFELDQLEVVNILREVASFIEAQGDDLQDKELMDGSYQVETSLGVAFFTQICE